MSRPWANQLSVQVRHRTFSGIASLRISKLEIPRRRCHMANVHLTRAKPRINVPRMGGCLETRSRPFYWYDVPQSFVTEVDRVRVDTMGYAFTFHIVSILAGVNIGAYVHYPTISTEMIHRVESRVALHNNSASVSSSIFLTQGKLLQVVSAIWGREHETDVCSVTGTIVYSCSSTRSLLERPLSSW